MKAFHHYIINGKGIKNIFFLGFFEGYNEEKKKLWNLVSVNVFIEEAES